MSETEETSFITYLILFVSRNMLKCNFKKKDTVCYLHCVQIAFRDLKMVGYRVTFFQTNKTNMKSL